MDVFPSLHKDDIGTKPVGYIRSGDLVDGIPVYAWYPDSARKREDSWNKRLIELGKEEAR